jgi:flagellar basal body P-ring protein FlgI
VAFVTTTNTTYVDEKTIAIAEGTSIFGTQSVTGETESATEVISTEEDTQAEETSGSVSEDDLLSTAGEDSEVVFDFPEEETTEETEVSQIFTYIIYK